MRIYLVCLVFVFSTTLMAQNFKKVEFQLDMGATVTIPYHQKAEIMKQFTGHPVSYFDAGLSKYIALQSGYNFTSRFSVHSGVEYIKLVTNIRDNFGFSKSTGKFYSTYLAIPLMFGYRKAESSPLTYSVGFYFGFLTNAREKGTTVFDTTKLVPPESGEPLNIDTESKYNNDIKKNRTNFDYGLKARVDYIFSKRNKLAYLGVIKFNYGLKNVITNREQKNNSAVRDWQNISLSIGIGIRM